MKPMMRNCRSCVSTGAAASLALFFPLNLLADAPAADTQDWLLPVLVIAGAIVLVRLLRKGTPRLAERFRFQPAAAPSCDSGSGSGDEAHLGLLFETNAVAVMVHEADTMRVLHANRRALGTYGVEDVEALNRHAFETESIWADPPYGIDACRARFRSTAQGGSQRFEWLTRRVDGSLVWEDVFLQPMELHGEPHVVSISIDISEQKQAQEREEHRNHVLTALAAGRPMEDILQMLVKAVESEQPSARCAILLLDRDGKHLRLGAAGNLPAVYQTALDGLRIGDGVGACGTAAYTGRRVITEDIETDPRWEGARERAREAGLRACWSEPVLSAGGGVLGTFAVYRNQPGGPSVEDIERMRIAVELASLTVDRRMADQDLARRSALEDVIRTVSVQLLDMTAARADEELAGALGVLGAHMGADRCYLMQLSRDDSRADSVYEWCAEDIVPMRERRHGLLTDRFADWLDRLRRHESIARTVVQDAEHQALYPESADIQSVLLVPMFQQGTLRGVLSFDAVRQARHWPESDMNLLKVAANLIGSALVRVELELELERQASYDSLTGLLNRRKFEKMLSRELRRASRYQATFAVIIFDVDHFKSVNDSFGHDVGDMVLRQLAREVRAHIRDSDGLGRWGGEEFILLLPETGVDDAMHVAESIRSALEHTHFDGPGTVTVSLGVSGFQPGDTLSGMLKRADRALYRAKEQGRNRAVLIT